MIRWYAGCNAILDVDEMFIVSRRQRAASARNIASSAMLGSSRWTSGKSKGE
jgi:hypothetical protein